MNSRPMLTWVNSYKSLSMHVSPLVAMFCQFIHLVAIATKQIQRFGLKCLYSAEDYSSNFSIKFRQHICNELEIKANSFFSVGWVISLFLIYIICPGLLSHFCLVISGLWLGIATPEMIIHYLLRDFSCPGVLHPLYSLINLWIWCYFINLVFFALY